MQSLFKSIFSSGKTAVLTPPVESHGEVPTDLLADLSLVPPKSSSADGAATAPAPEPKSDDPAVLQDFLLKNFLLDEQSAQTAKPAPEPPLVYAQTAMAAPETRFSYAHIPDPLPGL